LFNLLVINVNSCGTNPCLNGGICSVNTLGLQVCQCQPGFTGTNCNFSTTCANNPCLNGATCVDQSASGGTYYCQCQANFYGRNCDYRVTPQICSAGDTNSTSCQTWGYFGFCSFTYTYNLIPVPIYCPATCGICKQTTTCVDTQANCAIWASMGLCNQVNQIDANLCLKSCGNCVSGTR
jgi:hypothetical protein